MEGVLDGAQSAAGTGLTIIYGDQPAGMVYHIVVAPVHTCGAVELLDQSLQITLSQELSVARLVFSIPTPALAGKGHRGFQHDIWKFTAQLDDTFTEIEVGASCHTAYKVAVTLRIGLPQKRVQPGLERETPGVILPSPPGKGRWTVAGKGTGRRPAYLFSHPQPPPFLLYYFRCSKL